jgi:hypothetical protein
VQIRIQIGSTGERGYNEVSESWINEQINRRRADNQPACVRVTLAGDGVDMILSSAGCPSSSGGAGRMPNEREKWLFDLWEKRGLKNQLFTGGNLIAFLKQIS